MQTIAARLVPGNNGQASSAATRAMEATCREIIDQSGDGVLVIDTAHQTDSRSQLGHPETFPARAWMNFAC